MFARPPTMPLLIVSVLLAIAFLGAGASKLSGAEDMIANFERFGLGTVFMYFIGTCEVAGAIGLFTRNLAALAAAGLVIIMGGAIAMHLMAGDPAGAAGPPTVLMALSAFVAWSRRPQADAT